MALKDAPTTEIGQVRDSPLPVPGMLKPAGWGTFFDVDEVNPKLRWPGNVRIYDEMLNDGQIEALVDAIRLPLLRRKWLIDRNGARATVVKGVASDLGLPVKDDPIRPRGRVQGRFSWRTHLEHVLDAPFYGHYFFEQVGEIGPDGLWHLRKLAPRPPQSILQMNVAPDGGLEWIRQKYATTRSDGMGFPPEIPVDRLAAYVWGKRAGNWVGRSMLRSVYKHWLSKDILIRTDVTKHQRNGMGVPTARATDKSVEAGQLQAAAAVAQAWRAGEESSAGLPFGTDIELKGVTGSLPDTLASIKYHDEQMARRFLAMFLQLGQTHTGSRALGQSFMDFFALSLDAIAEWVCDVTNEHVIEDWVDWNYGPDEPAPLLISVRDEEPELAIADLVQMIEAHVITADPYLEAFIRSRYDLPALPDGITPASIAAPAVPVPGPSPHPNSIVDMPLAKTAGKGAATAPADPRRALTPVETQGAVDFAGIEQAYTQAVGQLVTDWQSVRDAQITELVAATQAASSMMNLAGITATPAGADTIEAVLVQVADAAVTRALTEAGEQGVTLEPPDTAGLAREMQVRAQAASILLAQSLTDSARRKAVALAGGGISQADVAGQVQDHLSALSDAWLSDQFTGAVAAAENSGRRTVFAAAQDQQPERVQRIYASALLDRNCCERCRERDGHEYDSLASFAADFPTGGFKGCEGGVRCRCTGVLVFDSETPASLP